MPGPGRSRELYRSGTVTVLRSTLSTATVTLCLYSCVAPQLPVVTGIIIFGFRAPATKKPLEQTWRGQALNASPKTRGAPRLLTFGRSSRPSWRPCCRRCSQRSYSFRTKRPVIYPLRSVHVSVIARRRRTSPPPLPVQANGVDSFVSSTSRIVLNVLRARRSEERKRRLGSGAVRTSVQLFSRMGKSIRFPAERA